MSSFISPKSKPEEEAGYPSSPIGNASEKLFSGSTLKLNNVSNTSVENLCYLSDINAKNMLAELHKRFEEGRPYTAIGGIMLAVNPHRWLQIYDNGADYVNQFNSGLPAHVFIQSAQAYNSILERKGRDQFICISGVAGSGKTETAKIIQSHLASVSAASATDLQSKLKDITLLVEAFGNAGVRGNDNSSRVGVVTDLFFSENDVPSLTGSRLQSYMLEKSRVVSHGKGECNFHILHQLLDEGASSALPFTALKGLKQSDIPYLATDPTALRANKPLADTLSALSSIGMSSEASDDLMKALAAVLHLGRIKFVSMKGAQAQFQDGSEVAPESKGALESAAELLGVTVEDLERSFLKRQIVVLNEVLESMRRPQEAMVARDAVAKAVYLHAFEVVMDQINQTAAAKGPPSKEGSTISLVDIFGFESFEVNSLEQLLINYAGELLQQNYVNSMFKAIETTCSTEGVDFTAIPYSDNKEVVALLGAPGGLISLLDEACQLKHGDDAGFVASLRVQLQPQKSELLQTGYARDGQKQDAHAGTNKSVFTVHHYARPVEYDSTSMVEKNRNVLDESAKSLLMSATNGSVATGLALELRSGRRTSSVAVAGAHGSRQAVKTSVASRFQLELRQLLQRMSESDVQFIWCIRPNPAGTPGVWDNDFVANQLRCASTESAANLLKTMGTPIPHEEFVKLYKCIAPKQADFKGITSALLPDGSYVIGKSKVFVGVVERAYLDEAVLMHKHLAAKRVNAVMSRSYRATKEKKAKAIQAEADAKAQAVAAIERAKRQEQEEKAAEVAREKQKIAKEEETKKQLVLETERAAAAVLAAEKAAEKAASEPKVEPKAEVEEEPELEPEPEEVVEEESEAVEEVPMMTQEEEALLTEENERMLDPGYIVIPTEEFAAGDFMLTPENALQFFVNSVPPSMGVVECVMVRRRTIVGNLTYDLYLEKSMQHIATALVESGGKATIKLAPKLCAKDKATMSKIVPTSGDGRLYSVFDSGVNPAKDKKGTARRELAVISMSLTRHVNNAQGPRRVEVITTEDGSSPVTGRDLKKLCLMAETVTPMWERTAGCFVLDFFRNRVKKQSVKNLIMRNPDTKKFTMQFGRSRVENTFVLDIENPLSPLIALSVALCSCDSNI